MEETIEDVKEKIRQFEKSADFYQKVKNENDNLKKELLSARSLLSYVVDGNPIPTFILDKNHKVIHWNQTFEKISGIRAAYIIGTDNQWQAFYDFKRPVMADLIIDGVDEETFWGHYKYNSEYTTLQK